MNNITENEMLFVLSILKHPELDFNANSLSKYINISPMGALKIAKKLEKDNILISKILGKAKFYSINFKSDYVNKYIAFLLNREAEQALPYIKRWIIDIKKINSAGAAILFGSILLKQEKANDIDVIFITDQKKFSKLKKEIEDINIINKKKIHPLYQTKEDFKKNIKIKDKVLLSAIKGIIVFGEEIIMELIKK